MKKDDDSKRPRSRKPPKVLKEPDTTDEDAVKEAQQVMWAAMGELKSAQVGYIRVAEALAEARDTGLYETLGYPDLESFAEERLQIARETLDRYLEVYDWIAKNRRQWLEPEPRGFIPDMADVADVIWIDRELSRKDLKGRTRAKLERLREKALKGGLRERDVAALRRLGRAKDEELMCAATELQNLRMEMSKVEVVPEEALLQIDAAIDVLLNELAVQRGGAKPPGTGKKRPRRE